MVNSLTHSNLCCRKEAARCFVSVISCFNSTKRQAQSLLLWAPAQHKRATMLYFANVFIFLWPPDSPALVNGGSRKFYTWWTLSVIREVTTWIFSWSSLYYRVGQKVTKFGIFSDPARKLSALTPNAAEYCNSEKKLVKHRWLLYTQCHVS